jgi:hypothetical protein
MKLSHLAMAKPFAPVHEASGTLRRSPMANDVVSPMHAKRRFGTGNDDHARRRLAVPPLTVEQLEEGLRMLDRGEIEPNLFWDQNALTFRETVILSIRETSEALRSGTISAELRAELESQIEPLKFYLEMANSCVARCQGRIN